MLYLADRSWQSQPRTCQVDLRLTCWTLFKCSCNEKQPSTVQRTMPLLFHSFILFLRLVSFTGSGKRNQTPTCILHCCDISSLTLARAITVEQTDGYRHQRRLWLRIDLQMMNALGDATQLTRVRGCRQFTLWRCKQVRAPCAANISVATVLIVVFTWTTHDCETANRCCMLNRLQGNCRNVSFVAI